MYFIRQLTHEYGSILVPQALILQPLQLKQRVRLGFLCAVNADFLACIPTGVPSESRASKAAAKGVPSRDPAAKGVPIRGPAAPAAAAAVASVTPAPVLAAAPALLALGPKGVRCNPLP